MYLARESPDELFDLSECDLRKVPDGTFSLVRVLLKTHLYLQCNSLRSLDSGGKLSDLRGIQVLNISSNKLSTIPDGLDQLTALRELNLCKNQLDIFPLSITRLRCLTYLNLEDNRLSSLPPDVGHLKQLVTLMLSNNPLGVLPREMVLLTKLERLTLPLENMRTPPTNICDQGLEAIFRYFSQDGLAPPFPMAYQRSSSVSPDISETTKAASPSRLVHHERKIAHMSSEELRRQLDCSLQAQAELTIKAHESRKKAIDYLTEESSRVSKHLAMLQRKREADRNSLVRSLISEEDRAAEIVGRLLERNASRHLKPQTDPTIFMLLEVPDSSFALRRQEILSSMENMLGVTDQAFRDYLTRRSSTNQRILDAGKSATNDIEQILSEKEQKQKQLTAALSLEDDFQKKAFAAFQSRCDSQSQQLLQDIELVEQELLRLTNVELDRKTKCTKLNIQCLAERRSDLLKLLVQLSSQQNRRQQELRDRLAELELRRIADQRDYWLIQYQRLLDHLSSESSAELDSDVYEVLMASAALHFVPNFLYHQVDFPSLSKMTDEDLQKIGVYVLEVRRNILSATELRMLNGKLPCKGVVDIVDRPEDASIGPSAPPEQHTQLDTAVDSNLPSAPPLDVVARVEYECCVCQEAKCLVIFLQCGHVCTCATCSEKLSVCPLCRLPIFQRIQIHFPTTSKDV